MDGADEPDEWRRYFERWGRVAYVTIARDNRKLLAALARRRRLRDALHEQSALEKSRAAEQTPNPSEKERLLGYDARRERRSTWRRALQSLGLHRDAPAWRTRGCNCARGCRACHQLHAVCLLDCAGDHWR